MQELKGSCLCGSITFKVVGDFDGFFLCHCKYCQKDTGSAHAANLFSSTGSLSWISGEELVKSYRLQDSKHAKSFCSVCGAAMPNLQLEEELLVVPAGSLDDDFSMRPTAHIFCSSKAKWDIDLNKINQFERLPK
jgi:hypothetical protein